MTTLQLNQEEVEELAHVLRSSLTSLDIEIHRTDKPEFKSALQHRHDVLQGILDRLPVQVPVTV